MGEESNEKWMTRVALSTAVTAVLAAVTTLCMGKCSSRTLLMRDKSLTGGAAIRPGASSPVPTKHREAVTRYDREKVEIKAKGEEPAKHKVMARERGGTYGFALIFLRIGVMLSSNAALTKKKVLRYFGMIVTVGRVFFFPDAILVLR